MNSDAKTTTTTAAAEPSFRLTPVPVVLFLLAGILAYLGQLYLDHYGGGFNAKVYEPYDSWEMVQDLQPKGEGDLFFERGQKLYNDAGCAACHQPSGLGTSGLNPPLAGSDWVLAEGPNRVLRIIHMGLTGPITVSGNQFNAAMPSMGRDLNLSAEDLAALATYIRGNRQWGNNGSPVTVEQAQSVLEQSKDRQTPWTADELLALPVQ
jgi:mono/diheme cytochrome c family protein